MNDDSHFMRSLSVEMAYYSERTLEIAETIERLRAALKRIADQDYDPFAANPARWPSTIASDVLEQEMRPPK